MEHSENKPTLGGWLLAAILLTIPLLILYAGLVLILTLVMDSVSTSAWRLLGMWLVIAYIGNLVGVVVRTRPSVRCALAMAAVGMMTSLASYDGDAVMVSVLMGCIGSVNVLKGATAVDRMECSYQDNMRRKLLEAGMALACVADFVLVCMLIFGA